MEDDADRDAFAALPEELIDKLSREFKAGIDGRFWAEIVEKTNAGGMPPEDEPQPTESEIAAVIDQLFQP